MMTALLITLRETIEVGLVIGIVLAYLNKTENKAHNKFVWRGLALGVLISLVFAYVLEVVFGGFEKVEALYEGIMMLFASGLLTWMILWMLKQRSKIKHNIENKLHTHLKKDHPWGIFALILIATLREGIETVIFLAGAQAQAASGNYALVLGAVSGILLAILLSVALFKGAIKLSLKKFFTVTSVLLILFAAGLFAHALHEFAEIGLLPEFVEHIWDLNFILNENSAFGSILKGLFGYNGNPSLLEVIGYLAYLVLISLSWKLIEKKA